MPGSIDLRALKAHIGEILQVRFNDGYTARVRLLDVDPDSAPHELIYDVVEVLNWGSVDPKGVDPNGAHASSAMDLLDWRVGD